MKSLLLKKVVFLAFCLSIFLFQACGDVSYVPAMKGVIEFQITDAASDDADIQSVFVTVTDIKADGQSISGMAKQTIDLTAYQAGDTKLLAHTILLSKTYHTLTLVLDADTDVNGNSPGCYVQTLDNNKHKLSNGKIEILVTADWSVTTNIPSALIMDFDLRKALRPSSDPASAYNLVSGANLNAAVRVMNRDQAGTINGIYADQSSVISDKVLVYAYRKGAYNAVTETQAQGDDLTYFKNAVSSSVVSGDGPARTYTLAFLEAGEYELHFASYRKDSGGNHFIFQTMLAAGSTINGVPVETLILKRGEGIAISSIITGSI